jgi:hypothetical protein
MLVRLLLSLKTIPTAILFVHRRGNLGATVLSAVVSRLQDKLNAAESGGVEAAAPTCQAFRGPR